MNHIAGFVIFLFASLLLIVSSVTNVKVTAQGNDSSSEKSSTAAKTCSPEQFKEQSGLCAAIAALAHNKEKESAASAEKASEKPAAEKPVENLKLFSQSSPIEVKKLPTMEEKTSGILTEKLQIKKPAAETGKCSAGKVKDWAGVCFPESEAKACPTCAPGSATTTSANPVSEKCLGLQTTTRSGQSLCLTSTPKLAYEAGAKKGAEAAAKCASTGKCDYFTVKSGEVEKIVYTLSLSDQSSQCSAFAGNDFEQCKAGFGAGWHDEAKKLEENRSVVPCKGPAGFTNGVGSQYLRLMEELWCKKPKIGTEFARP